MKKAIESSHKFDFNGGVALDNDTLTKHRIQVAERLANNADKTYSSLRAGNCLTVGVKSVDGEIIVYQAQGYIQHRYRIEDASEPEKTSSLDSEC